MRPTLALEEAVKSGLRNKREPPPPPLSPQKLQVGRKFIPDREMSHLGFFLVHVWILSMGACFG